MVYEVEYSCIVKDFDAVRKRLKSLCVRHIRNERKVLIYYVLTGDMNDCLRMDITKDSSELVYKRGNICASSKEEYTVKVSDPEVMHKIMLALGRTKIVMRRRYSEYYELDKINLVLKDDYGEQHVEIEKLASTPEEAELAKQAVLAMMTRLGFSMKDVLSLERVKDNTRKIATLRVNQRFLCCIKSLYLTVPILFIQ